jgi:hypothetical protein
VSAPPAPSNATSTSAADASIEKESSPSPPVTEMLVIAASVFVIAAPSTVSWTSVPETAMPTVWAEPFARETTQGVAADVLALEVVLVAVDVVAAAVVAAVSPEPVEPPVAGGATSSL